MLERPSLVATNDVAGAVTSVRLQYTQPSIGYNFDGGISADYGRLNAAYVIRLQR